MHPRSSRVRGQCTGAFWEVEYRQHLVHRAIKLMESDFGAVMVQACLQVVYGRPVAEVAR